MTDSEVVQEKNWEFHVIWPSSSCRVSENSVKESNSNVASKGLPLRIIRSVYSDLVCENMDTDVVKGKD